MKELGSSGLVHAPAQPQGHGQQQTPVPSVEDVAAVASDFGMSRAALAQTLGLEPDQFYTAPGTPAEAGHRMRDFLAIIGKIEPWAGSPQKAIDWYRNQPIPSLGNLTAEALVRQDQGALVHSYLEDYAAGAFA